MKLFNTMSRKKEEFVPICPGEAHIYCCGPTVYNLIHVGNARPLVIFDTLRRYLEYRGYTVTFVQNFTDVDDKMINRAKAEGSTVADIARRYISEYETDAKGLGIRPATVSPRATDNIEAIVRFIGKLISRGYAYAAGGDVYFRVRAFQEYGKLSHQPLDDLESGARVNINDIKEDPMDFALWKAAKQGEPFWPSPWGDGRPGWHIECSAMACRFLGETIDIHCGGQDLIFPHHENEVAQSEAANGAPFAHYWMHNGYINIDNRKMSKSEGNFFTVREVAEKYGYAPIRMLMLSSHYRSPINFSEDIIIQMQAALARLENCRENLDFLMGSQLPQTGPDDEKHMEKFNSRRMQFIEAMEDDLNTADAVSAIFDLVRDINAAVNTDSPSGELVSAGVGIFNELCDVLGIWDAKVLIHHGKASTKDTEQFTDSAKISGNDLDAELEALIEKRQQARKARDFKTADAIRDNLAARGIRLEDTPQGVKWSRI